MITISLRSYSSHIKSLLHFNYPYYAESGDGLTDDVSGFTWTRSGNAKLAGSEIPADQIITGTPKFGYRCLHTESSSDFITGTRSGAITLSQLEASMWLRVTASGTGNILQLKSGSTVVMLLTVGSDLKLTASSSSLGFSLTTTEALTLNTWTHIRLQVSASAVKVSLNNSAGSSASANGSALPGFSAVILGGLHGEIDEFVLRDSFTEGLPSEPEKAVCNINALGGFGDGRLGNITLTAACVMNTSAKAVLSSGKTQMAVSNVRAGKFGSFSAGNEVMLLNMDTGEYECRTISEISGSTLKVSKAFTMFNNGTQAMQVIQVPNFNTLTVNSGVTVSPNAWDGYSGGIIAFRVKGSCTINGSLITSGKGRPRTDSLQLTHSKLIDSFIMNSGGGIFITCGGTFTAGSGARLGATWDGSAKGGAPVSKSKGGNGGAGYGGAGCSDDDYEGLGGKGGVGGAGGGGDSGGGTIIAGDAGQNNSTGGFGNDRGTISTGGTQGYNGGNSQAAAKASGGGGAGGNSAAVDGNRACSGANIILVTKTLKADASAISTGGQGGYSAGSGATHMTPGGGGTGFCYIACERMA